MSTENRKARVGALAESQFGRIARWQLTALRITSSSVAMWIDQGYLHRVLPRVYAVGHRAPGIEADVAAALLYAGPGAALSHTTAAWWLGLIDQHPKVIHVSTPRQCRSLPRVRVHGKRRIHRRFHRGLPTTSLPQIFLDLAATTSRRTLRRALASADYEHLLDIPDLEANLTRGRPGAGKLREALQQHQPKLGLTKSRLERLFIELCETHHIPLPETNVEVDGWEVDALWRHARLAVELDGYGNHHTPAQLRRDRRKEMELRAAGLTPVRYSEDQLESHGDEVVAELRRLAVPPRDHP